MKTLHAKTLPNWRSKILPSFDSLMHRNYDSFQYKTIISWKCFYVFIGFQTFLHIEHVVQLKNIVVMISLISDLSNTMNA